MFARALRQHVLSYKDPNIKFLKYSLSQLPYLRHAKIESVLAMLFAFRPAYYEAGQYVFRQRRHQTERIIIVNSGVLELFTEFEGNEFIIERLEKYSIINGKNIFLEDFFYCSARCQTPCVTLELPEEQLWRVAAELPCFERQLKKLANRLLRKVNKYPLDFIKPASNPLLIGAQRRERVLKNCVYRIIVEKRIHKGKPRLHQLLELFRENGLSPDDPKDKQLILQQVCIIYSDKPPTTLQHVLDPDPRNDQLHLMLSRVMKQLILQNDTVDSISASMKRLYARQERRQVMDREQVATLKHNLRKTKTLRKMRTVRQKKKVKMDVLSRVEEARRRYDDLLAMKDRKVKQVIQGLVETQNELEDSFLVSLTELAGGPRQNETYPKLRSPYLSPRDS